VDLDRLDAQLAGIAERQFPLEVERQPLARQSRIGLPAWQQDAQLSPLHDLREVAMGDGDLRRAVVGPPGGAGHDGQNEQRRDALPRHILKSVNQIFAAVKGSKFAKSSIRSAPMP
jgi:hypothetical protein